MKLLIKKAVCLFIAFIFFNVAHADEENTTDKVIRIMTVVICQQDGYLQYLLEPYLSEKNIQVEYSQGHHSAVAQAVNNKKVDFVITHTKVKKLQKMEQQGLLNKGQLLFANPMAFLGPEDDPAIVSDAKNVVDAVSRILKSQHCFLINGHKRLADIQLKLVEQTGITEGCYPQSEKQNEAILGDVFENNAYTLWGLHPYAKRGNDKLKPIVIPDKMLLSNMTGWVVKGTGNEAIASDLLNYLVSEQARKRMTEFRLKNYSGIQAWWPAVK